MEWKSSSLYQGVFSMSFDLPQSVKNLHGTLFLVPFNLIEVPEADQSAGNYQFYNPRLITESGQNDLIDADLSKILKEDIKNITMMVPLICRYIQETKSIQLVGGDRRYRALSQLIQKHEMVRDPSCIIEGDNGKEEYAWKVADEVYKDVICQIYNAESDLDALAYSYSENACRKNLNDGHDVALLMELRKFKATDDQILSILQKNKLWLRDTDHLVKRLDSSTLNDLLEGRINRLAAIKLSEIDDVEERNEIRETANEIAESRNEQKTMRDSRRLNRATKEKQIAEVEIQLADQNDEVEIEIAQANLDVANLKVSDAVSRQRENKNSTKGKDIDAASKVVNGEDVEESKPKALKQQIIEENYIRYLTKVYKNDANCLEEEPLFNIPKQVPKKDVVMVAIRIAKAIHDGEENCYKVLKKCFSKQDKK